MQMSRRRLSSPVEVAAIADGPTNIAICMPFACPSPSERRYLGRHKEIRQLDCNRNSY